MRGLSFLGLEVTLLGGGPSTRGELFGFSLLHHIGNEEQRGQVWVSLLRAADGGKTLVSKNRQSASLIFRQRELNFVGVVREGLSIYN